MFSQWLWIFLTYIICASQFASSSLPNIYADDVTLACGSRLIAAFAAFQMIRSAIAVAVLMFFTTIVGIGGEFILESQSNPKARNWTDNCIRIAWLLIVGLTQLYFLLLVTDALTFVDAPPAVHAPC